MPPSERASRTRDTSVHTLTGLFLALIAIVGALVARPPVSRESAPALDPALAPFVKAGLVEPAPADTDARPPELAMIAPMFEAGSTTLTDAGIRLVRTAAQALLVVRRSDRLVINVPGIADDPALAGERLQMLGRLLADAPPRWRLVAGAADRGATIEVRADEGARS